MTLPKKVLIIHKEGNAFNNPSLKCIIDLLVENDVQISMHYLKSNASIPELYPIKLFSYGRLHNKIKDIIFNKIANIKLLDLYEKILWKYYRYDFDLVIGVDRMGLIEAAALSRIYGTALIFISFEIIFKSETGNNYKRIEILSSSYAKLWFVQDVIRQQCLISENKLKKDNSFILPLASAGIGEFSNKRLRSDLGIPENKNVAILMGSIADWTMSKEIVNSIDTWPNNWVLIIHNRYGDTALVIKKLNINEQLYADKIYISNHPSEMVDDMGYILNGVSAGIALYRPDFKSPSIGKNILYLGLSSGKIATYLRYGIPVIMNNIGLYSDLAKERGFGVVINNEFEIGKSLREIEKNKDKYHNAGIEYFKKELDFHKNKNKVYQNLSAL